MIAAAIAAIVAIPLGLRPAVQQRRDLFLRLWVYQNAQVEFWSYESWKNATIIPEYFGPHRPQLSDEEWVERHTELYGRDAGAAYRRSLYHHKLRATYETAWYSPWTTFLFDPFGP
jgi:hypothetical protein